MVDRFGLAAPTAKDHPRVCGEKFHVGFDLLADVQSPPRVRGKDFFYDDYKFIAWDHPRVCGEKRFSGKVWGRDIGSPPRVRGKDFPARRA